MGDREIDTWKPFEHGIMNFRDVFDRGMFEDGFMFPERVMWRMRYPQIDIKELPNKFVVKVEVPGVKEEDVNIEVSDSTLTVSGEKKEEKVEKDEEYCRRESFSGTFRRTVTLPSEIAGNNTEATFENGVLTVNLPKTEARKAIKVNIGKK